MVRWDCIKFAEALDPFVDLDFSKNYIDTEFDVFFTAEYLSTLSKKLGFITE